MANQKQLKPSMFENGVMVLEQKDFVEARQLDYHYEKLTAGFSPIAMALHCISCYKAMRRANAEEVDWIEKQMRELSDGKIDPTIN